MRSTAKYKILEIHEEDLGRYPSLSKATHERIKRAMRDLSPDPDPDLPKT
jgi:hypothetical protein